MLVHKKIAQNTVAQLLGKIISTALGLLAVVIITRHLGVEKFGWYITASSFLQFVGIIIDFGFTLTTTNLLAEAHFSEQKILNTIFSWRLLTAIICHALALVIFLCLSYPIAIKFAVIITTLSFFTSALNQVFIGYYQARLKNYVQMIAEVASRVVLVLGVSFVVITGQGFLLTMGIITLSSLVYTALLWYKSPKITLELDRTISKVLFKKTWPLALAVIFNALYLQGDRVLLPLFVPQTDVGLYGAAYKILDFIIQVAGLLMGIMLPLLTMSWTKNHHVEFKKYYQLSFTIVALFLFPALAGCIVLNTPLMHLIGGKNFLEAGIILSWLSITIVGICLGMIGGHAMLAINRQKISLIIFATDAVLSCIGYLIFIPHYGLWGAVGVTIFSEWYAGILLCMLTYFYTKLLPPLASLLKIISASLLMGGIIWVIQPLPLVFSLLIGVILYGAIIIVLKIIPPEIIKETLSSVSVNKKLAERSIAPPSQGIGGV